MKQEKKYKFDIIFEELEEISNEPEIQISDDELIEYEEIRTIREIVLDIQSPKQTYLSST